MLQETLQRYQNQFLITKIIEESYLKNWHRTAFSWTKVPNSVCLAMNRSYLNQALDNQNITGIITMPQLLKYLEKNPAKSVVISKKADQLFYYLHNLAIHDLFPETHTPPIWKIHPSARISESAIIAQNVSIGRNCHIHAGCQILDNTTIGNDCTIYNLATIGTEGFFSKNILDQKTHVKHFGGVKIGDNCIVHCGTNISRSVNWNEYTELADSVHIGIHSNIGHDCKIGLNTDISAKVMLAGRVEVGRNCWIGASTTISNALKIGDNATVKIGSVVIENIDENQTVSGNFAIPHISNLKKFVASKEKRHD